MSQQSAIPAYRPASRPPPDALPTPAIVRSPRRARRAAARSAAAARPVVRATATFARALAAGLALGLLLALTVPLLFEMRPLVVLSGSMEPVLRVGDVTVVQRISPHEARVGDVVTYKAPVTGRVTTHRLRAVRDIGDGRYAFTTKGDANNSVERWVLAADGQLSRGVYRVPAIGRALLWIHTPLGWALLVGLPLLLLGVQEIVRIWRRAPEAGDAPAPA